MLDNILRNEARIWSHFVCCSSFGIVVLEEGGFIMIPEIVLRAL
jgi:hypothetical protein